MFGYRTDTSLPLTRADRQPVSDLAGYYYVRLGLARLVLCIPAMRNVSLVITEFL